jgi:hypothetical protein
VRGQTSRQAPRPHATRDFLDAIFPIEVDKINRESHKERVDRLARNNPHPFSWRKTFAPEQSLGSFASASSDLRVACQFGFPRYIDHLQPIGTNSSLV